MQANTQTFFDTYSKAYETGVAHSIAVLYFVPAVIMSEEKKNVFTKVDDIAGHVQGLMDQLHTIGVAKMSPDVCQTMRLSENILFSNVNWSFFDEHGQHIFSCFVSYTLQIVDEQLKIIVSVIDDEEREIAKLLE